MDTATAGLLMERTHEGLKSAGYVFLNRTRCASKGCNALIEWWKTPKGTRMPFNASDLRPQVIDCANQSWRVRRQSDGGRSMHRLASRPNRMEMVNE